MPKLGAAIAQDRRIFNSLEYLGYCRIIQGSTDVRRSAQYTRLGSSDNDDILRVYLHCDFDVVVPL
ncbi:hypothetical protein HNI00_17170 [Thermoleptolyngbya oregonensis NK1-22]|uniref:Uncharacterized protein n=1 Tax=Thermoleptolyngbya oregonensis NK1-22 TaxID=2547457 RepID=A0AA96YA78_9CYAN|nr:hypothetical protein [Thermoleptolyngbya oregonensis]WOB44688.1 hypothetical protein HNI00_17170 [Thermoleptolyngbya oregonensis NK1-22]